MRKIWTKSSKRRSISASSKLSQGDDSPSLMDAADSDASSVASHLRSLVDPEYDIKTVKHAWLNGVLNASPSQDFTEAALRLYRVELRGSHLYVFRPPSSLNVRSFKHEVKISSSSAMAITEPESYSIANSDQVTTLLGKEELRSFGDSTAATSSSTFTSTSELNSDTNDPIIKSGDTKSFSPSDSSIAEQSPNVTSPISYYSHLVPHPDLDYDSSSEVFGTASPIEALVHFFIFADSSTQNRPLRHLSTILPLLPKFGDVLGLIHAFLQAISSGKFEDYELQAEVCERVLSLLKHVDDNFKGFLLETDVAPHIPKLLQFLSANSVGSLESITRLQESIVAKQKDILGLIGNVDHANPSVSSKRILSELSYTRFLHNINLLDFVAVISEVDLMFFKSWNTSLDKSLLLYTSICEKSPGDHFYKKNSLVFNNGTHIHYLSRLMVQHLFIENPQSSPETLAHLLEKWIDVGCLLDKSGNMSAWLGISSVILSQPILRLSKVWAHVGANYIDLLKNDWSPVLFEFDRRHLSSTKESFEFENSPTFGLKTELSVPSKESYHIMAPRGLCKLYSKEKVIPYFGDLLLDNTKSTNVSDLESFWKKITFSLERWSNYLENVTDAADIISYNQDVLRQYEAKGFIFSNESLNQVLYLGVNKDDAKGNFTLPKIPPMETPDNYPIATLATQSELRASLLRLLEFNCDSMNLDTVMTYSLNHEPIVNESYLKPSPDSAVDGVTKPYLKDHASSISIDSTSSSMNRQENDAGVASVRPHPGSRAAKDRLPSFNIQHYEIHVSKYDDLMSPSENGRTRPIDDHNIVVDSDLVLRLDDFISDAENPITPTTSALGSDRAAPDEDGLGIDVDDIMNSEKFRNFSISSDIESADENLPARTKHNSFGLISHHSNRASQSRSDKYIPRLASMDKLIDLLLIDSKYFDSDHPIDLAEYRSVFMLNYSSFITTKEFLEKLAHRFVHSGNAVISIMIKQLLKEKGTFDPITFGVFPKWSSEEEIDLSQLGEVDYALLLQIQTNILKVLMILLASFFESFLNDLHNKNIMIRLLKLFSNEILQWYNSNKIDKRLNEPFENLVDSYKKLKKLFIKKSYRPLEVSKFEAFLTRELSFSRSIREVPTNRNLPSCKNVQKAEKFLNKFNKLLAIFYQGVTAKDWFTTFKIIENMFVSNTLLNHDYQRSSTPEEHLRISDIFTFLETAFATNTNDKILNRLPVVFQKLVLLHSKFKAYILNQLCDVGISNEERVERMKTLLLMIQISRLKMKDSQFVFEGNRDEIPSCIETAITSVIYSPESRSFSQVWHKINPNTDGNLSDLTGLEALLPTHVGQVDLLAGGEPLLPCFGWIIQNFVHFNTCPSFHRSAINFNKRYFLFKLIKELNVEESRGEDLHNETKEFEFLLNFNETFIFADLSKHFANGHSSGTLFSAIIKRQYSIIMMDDQKRNTSDKRLSTLSLDLGHGHNNSSSTSLRRQSLAYKTAPSSRFKISGLFNKSRTFGHTGAYERSISYKELPDPQTVADSRQKPALIIQLKDKKIFPIYLLPYCFKLDSNHVNEACFFQALDEIDCKGWLDALSFANRHWFFSKSLNLKAESVYITFGVPLATVCARDASESPRILNLIYKRIEDDGLKEVGIYRISTSLSELSSTKAEINKSGFIDFKNRDIDVHTLTSCVKSFFRELPDALLTDNVIEMLYPLKRPAGESSKFSPGDASAFHRALLNLPRVNYITLKALVCHLSKVVRENETNKMTCSNLATVIGPALTEASNMESLLSNFGIMNHVLERLIENYESVFEGSRDAHDRN